MASVPNHDSAARRLNKDVLSAIFMSNADMFNDETALYTTWRTSHVCKEWRNILLDLPALWGRLLDMNILQRGKRKWGREVLRRSGTSSALWIRATRLDNRADYGDSTRTKKLLFSILDDHWERVERLTMNISVMKIHPTHWRVLYEPAPLIQVFDVQLYDANEKEIASVNSLFNDVAPSLRSFRAQNLTFGSQAQWLAGLRSLSFRDDRLSLVDLLKMLQIMPLLTHLKFEKIGFGEPEPNSSHELPLVSLPDLQSMTIFLDITEWDAFLEHVTPSKGCTILMRDFNNATSAAIPGGISLRRLAVLAEDYCRVHQPSSTTICVRSSTFRFELGHDHSEDTSFRVAVFMPNASRGFAPESLSSLLSVCDAPSLKALTRLQLEQFDVPSADLALKTFSALHGIETLCCDEGVLTKLLEQQQESGIIFFPRLKHLKVGRLIGSYFTGTGSEGFLFNFLQSRQDAGCPIITLDLTACNPNVSPKLTRLEAMTGLKILWKIWSSDEVFEYECGSGYPERIPFPHGVSQAPLRVVMVSTSLLR